MRTTSISNSFCHKNYRDVLEQFEEEYNRITHVDEDTKKLVSAFWAEQYVWFFSYFDKSGKDFRSTIKENDHGFEIMKYGLSVRAKTIRVCITILGKYATVKLLIWYQHFRSRYI